LFGIAEKAGWSGFNQRVFPDKTGFQVSGVTVEIMESK
jgi:hypothetical protein